MTPNAASTAFISIITFADTAYMMPLVPISQFTPPYLYANGKAALGGALWLLNESLDIDLIPASDSTKGDFKSLVFLLTNGRPTDHWQAEALRLTTRSDVADIVGIGIGDDADMNIIRQVSRTALMSQDITWQNIPDLFQNLFRQADGPWTVDRAAAGRAGTEEPNNLPPPPPRLIIQL